MAAARAVVGPLRPLFVTVAAGVHAGAPLEPALRAYAEQTLAEHRAARVAAVRRLAHRAIEIPGTMILDAPGVTRGVAASELLAGLIEAARIQALVVLTPPELLPAGRVDQPHDNALIIAGGADAPFDVFRHVQRAADLERVERPVQRLRRCPRPHRQTVDNIEIEFAPRLSRGGPKKHMFIREPSGIRLEFAHTP